MSGHSIGRFDTNFGTRARSGVEYQGASNLGLLSCLLIVGVDEKITILIAGFFRTQGYSKAELFPLHPAYTNPNGGPAKIRAGLVGIFTASGEQRIPSGDTNKAAKKVHELSLLSDPPMRLWLGEDAIAATRRQLDLIKENLDGYEDWSEDLLESAS